MTSRVASPDDKVDITFEVFLYPAECFVYEGKRRVAFAPFRPKVPRRAFSPMACVILVNGSPGLVVRVWM